MDRNHQGTTLDDQRVSSCLAGVMRPPPSHDENSAESAWRRPNLYVARDEKGVDVQTFFVTAGPVTVCATILLQRPTNVQIFTHYIHIILCISILLLYHMKYDIHDFTCCWPAATSSPLKPPFLLAPTIKPPARPLDHWSLLE